MASLKIEYYHQLYLVTKQLETHFSLTATVVVRSSSSSFADIPCAAFHFPPSIFDD